MYCSPCLPHQQAEKYLKASGLDYTIVRPGGLSNEPESAIGNLIAKPEDSLFGLETDPGRQISRDTVSLHACMHAWIVVEHLLLCVLQSRP